MVSILMSLTSDLFICLAIWFRLFPTLSLIGVMGPPVIVNMGPLKIEIMGPVADRNYRATRDRNYGASSQG